MRELILVAMAASAASSAACRSLLPPMVIQRFGVMPALPLDERQLTDAERYILSLNRGVRMGRSNGMRQGMPMMPGRPPTP